MEELRDAEVVDYQTTLLAFINCVVLGAGSLPTRAALRNEFIGEFVITFSAASLSYSAPSTIHVAYCTKVAVLRTLESLGVRFWLKADSRYERWLFCNPESAAKGR